MKELTIEVKDEIRDLVYDYFAEECEVERDSISDASNVIDELDGDSLMFVELVEILKKKYQLDVQIQNVGKYLLKNPAETVGAVIDIFNTVYEKENAIVDGE